MLDSFSYCILKDVGIHFEPTRPNTRHVGTCIHERQCKVSTKTLFMLDFLENQGMSKNNYCCKTSIEK